MSHHHNTKSKKPAAVQQVIMSKEEISALPTASFPEPGRMIGGFQTIFAAETTPTNELTFGIAKFPAKTAEKTSFEALHCNIPAEFYYITQGKMYLLLEGKEHRISAGDAVFIPAGAEHGFCNPSYKEELVFVWGLAVPGFDGIGIQWSEENPDWVKVEDW